MRHDHIPSSMALDQLFVASTWFKHSIHSFTFAEVVLGLGGVLHEVEACKHHGAFFLSRQNSRSRGMLVGVLDQYSTTPTSILKC